MREKSYSIARLKNSLSSIVADVAGGAEVVVTDHNRPVARMVPLSRLPSLPDCDVSRILSSPPISFSRPPKKSSAQLVRSLRDEGL
jgi:prevent-host-death family protein